MYFMLNQSDKPFRYLYLVCSIELQWYMSFQGETVSLLLIHVHNNNVQYKQL